MISFRHHVVSLVAVFLALATGVVLGAGPLSSVEPDLAADDPTSPAAQDARAAFSEDFATAVGPQLLAGSLDGRSVSVVSLPGSDGRQVDALVEQIGVAGGSVAGRLALTEAMVDPGQKSLVDTLGSQLARQQGSEEVPADAPTYERIGQLLGTAVASTQESGARADAASDAILQGLRGAELVTGPDEWPRRAPLVLLVLGDAPEADGGTAILDGLARGLGRAATGVVVAGTVADGGDGQLGTLRAGDVADEVVTVDGIDTAAGRVATVLALARSADTAGAEIGASGSDGAVPLG